jgi:hypothetical protein
MDANRTVSDVDHLPVYMRIMLSEWIKLSGARTIYAFCALPCSEQTRIVWYLSNKCPASVEIPVNDVGYILCHDELSYGYVYDAILVTGHTPTRFLKACPTPDRIWRDGDRWRIDCGCGYGGQLGCVCLDTGEEFYV